MASAEAVPFAKTGGLGDVCGSLPVALTRLGHTVDLILPAYRQALTSGQPVEDTGQRLEIPIGNQLVRGRLLSSRLPDSPVRVFLVQQDAYFDRDGLYGEESVDYKDNCERFVFFGRSVLETIRLLDLKTDLVHANDWQAGLVPAFLKVLYASEPPFDAMASLFTIHNLAYQGNFWHWDMLLTGLDWKYFNWRQMEFFGDLSFMKTALTFADAISTVSPRYAEEIQTDPLGCGMEGVLAYRRDDLAGILNGVDYRQWNPVDDVHLAANYGPQDYPHGKAVCKQALQQEVGLSSRPDVPLVASIGRLTQQKGFDLLSQVISQRVEADETQWVVLGTGEARYARQLERLAHRYPSRVAMTCAFSTPLAHRIYAGADVLVVPSRYEPCGLNQLYALKYGTVPVVRATGGLVDTIEPVSNAALAAGTANGYRFVEASAAALSEVLTEACNDFRNRGDLWRQLIETGMHQDWSWAKSARHYADLYRRTISRRRQAIAV